MGQRLDDITKEVLQNGALSIQHDSELQNLFNQTRDATTRKQLGQDGLIDNIVEQLNVIAQQDELQSFLPYLNWLVKLARNLCPNNTYNQDRLRETKCLDPITQILERNITKVFSSENQAEEASLLTVRLIVQLYINFITANENNQEQFWNYVHRITPLFEIEDRTLFCHLCMLVYNSVCKEPQRRKSLWEHPKGIQLMEHILQGSIVNHRVAEDEAFDWIYFLVNKIFQDGNFVEFYTNMGIKNSNEVSSPSKHTPRTRSQVIVMKLLDSILFKALDSSEGSNSPKFTTDSGNSKTSDLQIPIDEKLCTFLSKEFVVLFEASKPPSIDNNNLANQDLEDNNNSIQDNNNTTQPSQDNNNPTVPPEDNKKAADQTDLTDDFVKVIDDPMPLDSNDFEVLFLLIQILGMVTSADGSILRNSSILELPKVQEILLQEGALIACIELLLQGYRAERNANKAHDKASSEEKAPSLSFGFKRDVIRIVANMAFQNKVAQDQIREHGGIGLLLNHCKIDDENPYIKEWSVLALRNLCENNPDNQKIVDKLKIAGIADNMELKNMGLKAEIQNGKIKIMKVDMD